MWKDRELSVPRLVLMGMNAYNTQEMRFIDIKKGEMWVFNPPEVITKGTGKWWDKRNSGIFQLILQKREIMKEAQFQTLWGKYLKKVIFFQVVLLN